MTFLKSLATAGTLSLATLTNAAFADDLANVRVFYDFLSNPGSEAHADSFLEISTPDWASFGDYSGAAKSREAFVGQLGGFSKLIPDLNWEIQAMHQDENVVVVRGRATGTPVGPFFGVDGEGRSFDIMSIDIHELEDGKIARSYHVEDWAGALQQLSGK